MPETRLGDLVLRRWPRQRGDTLQAFDGADRYLLRLLDEEAVGARTLVINDQGGALWLGAGERGPTWSAGDDWVARRAALANGEDNRRPLDEAHWLWPWQTPPESPDQVLLRLPKSLSLLEGQLAWLAGWLPAGTPILAAGMDKHLPPQLVPLMERYLGETKAGLGWKKARVFRASAPGEALAPMPEPATVALPARGWTLSAGPGVFGRRHLDIGARFLLQHLPREVTGRAADLGCGNGVLGLSLAADNPEARVTFCDVSSLAVDSARHNAETLFGAEHGHRFHLRHGLDGVDEAFDLILLNPPFHRGHAVDDRVARTLFRHAHRQLAPGGELRVVANQHLPYWRPLAKLFGQAEILARNEKFVIYRCVAAGG